MSANRWIRLASIGFASIAMIAITSAAARADSLSRDERGFNRVTKGVWQLGAGSLFAFAQDSQGDTSALRLTADAGATVSYFFRDNVSADVTGVFAYNTTGDDNSATALGGVVGATAHLRLGHGAFFRPGLGLGMLIGNREIPTGASTVMEASQIGFAARLRLPIAYFISRSLYLEGGPQFNLTAGSYTPEGAEAIGFTTVDGGFSVGFGYTF